MQLTSEKKSDSCFDNWPGAMKIGLLTNRNEGVSYKAGRKYNVVFTLVRQEKMKHAAQVGKK